jgi:hypothetical protein
MTIITPKEKFNLATGSCSTKTCRPQPGWSAATLPITSTPSADMHGRRRKRSLATLALTVRRVVKDLASYFGIDRSQRQHEYHPIPDKLSAIASIDTGHFCSDTGHGCTPKPDMDVPPSFLDPLKHPLTASARKKRRGNRQEKAGAQFEKFWQAKPGRGKNQANPKAPARAKFIAAVRNGIDPHKIIAAAREWARQEQANGNIDSRFVATAVVWLNQKRFDDYAEAPAANGGSSGYAHLKGGFVAPPGSAAFSAWKAYCTDHANDPKYRALKRELENREQSGKSFDFETEWPPERRGQNE